MPDSSSGVEWLKEETSAGCTERSFLLSSLPGPVPGVLWSLRDTVPQATVLGRTHPDDETSWQDFIRVNTHRTSR